MNINILKKLSLVLLVGSQCLLCSCGTDPITGPLKNYKKLSFPNNAIQPGKVINTKDLTILHSPFYGDNLMKSASGSTVDSETRRNIEAGLKTQVAQKLKAGVGHGSSKETIVKLTNVMVKYIEGDKIDETLQGSFNTKPNLKSYLKSEGLKNISAVTTVVVADVLITKDNQSGTSAKFTAKELEAISQVSAGFTVDKEDSSKVTGKSLVVAYKDSKNSLTKLLK